MSKRSAKVAGPITRRQQIAGLRQMKAQEVAESVAANIRGAVKQAVDEELKKIKDTMLDLIDRVVDLETKGSDGKPMLMQEPGGTIDRNGDSGQEGTEAPEVPEDDEVVPKPIISRDALGCPIVSKDDAGGGLRAQGVRGDLHC